MYKVYVMEYERGWGSRVDEVKTFPNEQSALDFVKSFNARNTEAQVPDWYMVADGPYKVN
jgi:hypothetical protein